jgi:hypothetical protein
LLFASFFIPKNDQKSPAFAGLFFIINTFTS